MLVCDSKHHLESMFAGDGIFCAEPVQRLNKGGIMHDHVSQEALGAAVCFLVSPSKISDVFHCKPRAP